MRHQQHFQGEIGSNTGPNLETNVYFAHIQKIFVIKERTLEGICRCSGVIARRTASSAAF